MMPSFMNVASILGCDSHDHHDIRTAGEGILASSLMLVSGKQGKLGFNCMAIDQRSGQGVNKVTNETAKLAAKEKKATNYDDAEQDMVAALQYAKENFAQCLKNS